MNAVDIENELRSLAAAAEDKIWVFGPVADETIEAAEEELGSAFPPSYRVFLRTFGAGVIVERAEGFNGLPDTRNTDDEMPTFWHVVDASKDYWQPSYGHPGLPTHLIHIMSDGGDYNYFLDASQRDDRGEYPVVVLGPGAPEIVVAMDFLDFVRKLASRERLF